MPRSHILQRPIILQPKKPSVLTKTSTFASKIARIKCYKKSIEDADEIISAIHFGITPTGTYFHHDAAYVYYILNSRSKC